MYKANPNAIDRGDITIKKMCNMRKPMEEEMMHVFCNYFVPCIVGKAAWKRTKAMFVISKIMTVSDEAFLLLVLENNWDLWMEMAEHDRAVKDCQQKPKYTNAKGNGRTIKGGGWMDEGLHRYNEIHEMVVKARKENKRVEEVYMEICKTEQPARKRRKIVERKEEVVCHEDDPEEEDMVNLRANC